MNNLPEWMMDVASVAMWIAAAAVVLALVALWLSLRGLTQRDEDAREREDCVGDWTDEIEVENVERDYPAAKRPPRVR